MLDGVEVGGMYKKRKVDGLAAMNQQKDQCTSLKRRAVKMVHSTARLSACVHVIGILMGMIELCRLQWTGNTSILHPRTPICIHPSLHQLCIHLNAIIHRADWKKFTLQIWRCDRGLEIGSLCADCFPRGGIQEDDLVLISRSIMSDALVEAD